MKNAKLLFKSALAILALALTSCSADDSVAVASEDTSEMRLFLLDTARIKTISAIGTNEQTVLDKQRDLNSYIASMSISPDGTKFVFSEHQTEGTFPNQLYKKRLKIANSDGSGEAELYSNPDNSTHIGNIRFCSDGKIYFETYTIGNNGFRKKNLINADGTGLQDLGFGNYTDISDDRIFALLSYTTGTAASCQILDLRGDGGAGSGHHMENFAAGIEIGTGRFTNNGKLAVIPFKEGSEIKVRIIDVAAKTSTSKTLVTGLSSGWLHYELSMSKDNNRGVITLTGGDYEKSKTYVFNLETGEVAAPFENNDENIFSVYAY